MSVDLSGGNTFVSQYFLKGSDVNASVRIHQRRGGMTEFVHRIFFRIKSSFDNIFFYGVLNCFGTDAFLAFTDEQGMDTAFFRNVEPADNCQ